MSVVYCKLSFIGKLHLTKRNFGLLKIFWNYKIDEGE